VGLLVLLHREELGGGAVASQHFCSKCFCRLLRSCKICLGQFLLACNNLGVTSVLMLSATMEEVALLCHVVVQLVWQKFCNKWMGEKKELVWLYVQVVLCYFAYYSMIMYVLIWKHFCHLFSRRQFVCMFHLSTRVKLTVINAVL
jgi:hypothetical protein